MIKIAVVGTSWITETFIKAVEQIQSYQVTAVYSRDLAKAQEFARKFNIPLCFTSLIEMAESPEIEAVYIASPNSLHYSQASLFLNHKKHVICEKPLCSNIHETENLIHLAKKNNVILFEALKTYWHPNFVQIKTHLPRIGKLHKAFLHYCQYSSRYPAYLAGQNPNTFNPLFSNGSVMDIGIYGVGFAAAMWGMPKRIHATANLLPSGVDAHGTIMLDYGAFDVTICHSKVSNSFIPSEIQGEAGTFKIDHLSYLKRVILCSEKGEEHDISLNQESNSLYYGAHVFAKLIHDHVIDHPGLIHTLNTAKIITEVRKLTGIYYPADKEYMS